MKWYEFFPCDTLFFKGASAMVMGENHSALSHFPPLPETITGAIRTKILIENGIDFIDYRDGKVNSDIFRLIGKAYEGAPFLVSGPFIKSDDTIFVPAPYSWFKDKNNDRGAIIKSKLLDSSLVKTPSEQLMWAKGTEIEVETLGGQWINIESVNANAAPVVRKTDTFYMDEIRSGNALQQNRRVREGHLYSFSHIRLNKCTSLVFGLDIDNILNDEGILSLGGEKRFGHYKTIKFNTIENKDGRYYMSSSMIPTHTVKAENVLATGKIVYRGGWDIARGFHKPMIGYYPAGTVFNKKINNNFIAIQE